MVADGDPCRFAVAAALFSALSLALSLRLTVEFLSDSGFGSGSVCVLAPLVSVFSPDSNLQIQRKRETC